MTGPGQYDLNRLLDRLAAPVPPESLAGRIIREVPRLPQAPPPPNLAAVCPANDQAPQRARSSRRGLIVAAILALGAATAAMLQLPNAPGSAPRTGEQAAAAQAQVVNSTTVGSAMPARQQAVLATSGTRRSGGPAAAALAADPGNQDVAQQNAPDPANAAHTPAPPAPAPTGELAAAQAASTPHAFVGPPDDKDGLDETMPASGSLGEARGLGFGGEMPMLSGGGPGRP